jgi:subtilisin family serine protease
VTRALALLLALAALALPAAADAAPGRIALGLAGADAADRVAFEAWQLTGSAVDRSVEELGAIVVSARDVGAALPALRALPGVAYAEPIERSRELEFTPDDPLAFFQWHLAAIHAFDFWEQPPTDLEPIRVAVIDSGIDGANPDLAGRVAASRSFVGGRATEDTEGHGTLVAGEIAAITGNALGVAGVGLPVELLVAKVVHNGSITTLAEAKAIHWAVDNGAQVINLSLGGRRDPRDPAADEYSRLEADAIRYAYRNGAIVVAAVGNSDACPYPFASYPAALPHVLGVSALTQVGTAACFSNRDPVFNDVIAPGVDIISTFPVAMTDPGCGYPGFSLCAKPPYGGNGTSFSAPLASAAAAVLLSVRPSLTASQVLRLLESSARDLGPPGRDAAYGAGLLDVQAALQAATSGPLPPADRFEPNDDTGSSAQTLYGRRNRIRATIDYFDDPSDVYRVYLRTGRRASVSLRGPAGAGPTLVLWRPGTAHITPVTALAVRSGFVLAYRRGARATLSYRVPRSGWYYVEVKAPKRRTGPYELVVSR